MKISIIGASGYSGAELLKLLLAHPSAEVAHLFASSSAGKRVDEIYPFFRKRTDAVYESYSPELVRDSELIFIALPSGEAMNIVPDVLSAGKRVIDLGGDFRLHDPSLYERYYKRSHQAKKYLPGVYGLPEWNREKIVSAQLVANPGCYATSALLALLPVVIESIIEPIGITVSSLSGVSGAGRSSSVDYSFTEVNESVRAYKIGVHQHTPEIETVLNDQTGFRSAVTFVPHLIPITRGIYSSIYGTLKQSIQEDAVAGVFKKYYASKPFVRLIGSGVPEIKNVNYTNYCDISWKLHPENNQLMIFSTIDNLIKGAAGQAVQNMNLMFGFNETEGLL